MKHALITGISGQDGYFLSKMLIEKGYVVHGTVRRNSRMSHGTLERMEDKYRRKLNLHYGDITDGAFISQLMKDYDFDEVYHLAAQSFVAYSFQNPASTYDINISGTLNVVNGIKDLSPDSKLYFAATSEMFGQPRTVPQNEKTPLHPRSPYAISKLAGFWTVRNYREAYSLFMCNGILFNHESEVRGPEFVTMKIAKNVARILSSDSEPLVLGNLDARKDWGYAKDYVEGMWSMLQQDEPDDFVLATGDLHTVREFVTEAFRVVGVQVEWQGTGIDEIGKDLNTGDTIVRVNKKFYRPLESDNYQGDCSKATESFGWKPKTTFRDLVRIMVEGELQTVSELKPETI